MENVTAVTRSWKMSLLQDHENVTVNVVAAVIGSWEMSKTESGTVVLSYS